LGLLELNPSNRLYTWKNNKENSILARIDRIFASTKWDANITLTRVRSLDKLPSDHTPLLIDSGESMNSPKQKFRFEKWWPEKDSLERS
jgi:hypothetical protein